jgi:hypothetical protein
MQLMMKKIVLPILLTAALLWFVFTLNGVKQTIRGDKVITPGIGATIGGIYCFNREGPPGLYFLIAWLPGIDSKYIDSPQTGTHLVFPCPITIISHSLVYWSPKDRALCVARLDQDSRWYKLAKWLPADTDICSVCASKTKIYLNIYHKGVPQNTVRLDPVSGAIIAVPGAVEIRAHENSDAVAVLEPRGFVQFWNADNKPISGRMKPGEISCWDADAGTKVVCREHAYSPMYLFDPTIKEIVGNLSPYAEGY